VVVLLLGLLILASLVQQSTSRRALAAYMAELEAQGEALTWEALGYPPPPETNSAFDAFLAAVNKLGQARPNPGELDHLQFAGPGTVRLGWTAARPLLSSSSKPGTNAPTWMVFLADMRAASNALAELRASLQDPPRYFPINLTNPLATTPKQPFVQKRNAAQWLAADTLAGLREEDLARARADLHALTQMVQLHRDDTTLVSAMIRVAIAGLGLSATWESLPASGWTEPSLAELQRDWEAIDLGQGMQRAIETERVWALQCFESIRRNQAPKGAVLGTRPGSASPVSLHRLADAAASQYWRAHMDEDSLLYLRQMQDRIVAMRRLQTNAPGPSVVALLQDQQAKLDATLDEPLNRYRYLFTAIAMPNYSRATQIVVRTETQRRMTILAIALQRYRLRKGHFPAGLEALVREYISAPLVDPMSGQPLCYRIHADGTFTLYSVGEDGQDDGGDASSTHAPNALDLWSGRDAVWPSVLTSEPDPGN
jgi:type II secretory pathway pseudopilin PulG